MEQNKDLQDEFIRSLKALLVRYNVELEYDWNSQEYVIKNKDETIEVYISGLLE